MLLLALMLASLLGVGLGQRIPTSPCPNVFEYQAVGQQWAGHVIAPAPKPGVPLVVTVKLYIAAILPSQQSGRLSLWQDKNVIAREINAQSIQTVDYDVTFPIQSPLPQVDQIVVNRIIVCQGPTVTARALTKVTLEHTLFPLAQPLPSDRQPPGNNFQNQPDRESEESFLDRPFFPETGPAQRWGSSIPPIPYRPTTTTTTRRPSRVTSPKRPPTRTTTTTERPEEDDEYDMEQEAMCGYPIASQPLILRGTPTERGEWPWLTAIYLEEKMTFVCGGTLINSRHVITAGHCIQDRFGDTKKKEELVVVSGKYDLTRWAEPKNQAREVSEIHLHPDYDYITMANDVAVLTLDFPVRYTLLVRPICLWDTDSNLDRVVGKIGTVVGWGRDETSEKIVDTPQMARIPVVSQETCLRSRPEFRSYTNERTLCAGFKNGTGPCSGDSGGGFVLPVEQENGSLRWFLRGVVSLSLNDRTNMICDLREYVIYTDVAKYSNWLRQFRRS